MRTKKSRTPRRIDAARALVGLLACLLLAATAETGLAQRKSSPLRNRSSKEELLKKAEEKLKEATKSDEDTSREEAGRRALEAVNEALDANLQNELDAEAQRLTDGVQTPASEKLAAVKSVAAKMRNEAEATDEVKKLLDDVPAGLIDEAAEAEPEAVVAGADGMLVKTTDGKTLKVPGIQVAGQFTGKVIPIEGNGPPPGAKPAPRVKRLTKEEQKAASRKVVIESTGGAVFSATGQVGDAAVGKKPGPPIVIFEKDVVVTSGDTLILCDRLTVYMKEAGPEPAKEGKDPAANADAAGPAGPAGGGIERAVATGRTVWVQKTVKDPKTGKETKKIGQARKVTYIDATKDVILEDWPQVQEGVNLQKATSADTIMTIGESGKMTAVGPTSAEFMPEADLTPARKSKTP